MDSTTDHKYGLKQCLAKTDQELSALYVAHRDLLKEIEVRQNNRAALLRLLEEP